MIEKMYALLTDMYLADAPIYVFHDRHLAEQAMRTGAGEGAGIVSFISPELMTGAATGLVYLAMSMEDTGVRIHAAFRSMFGLRAFLLDQVTESPCVAGMGWLDPAVENGRVVERFQLQPILPEGLTSAA